MKKNVLMSFILLMITEMGFAAAMGDQALFNQTRFNMLQEAFNQKTNTFNQEFRFQDEDKKIVELHKQATQATLNNAFKKSLPGHLAGIALGNLGAIVVSGALASMMLTWEFMISLRLDYQCDDPQSKSMSYFELLKHTYMYDIPLKFGLITAKQDHDAAERGYPVSRAKATWEYIKKGAIPIIKRSELQVRSDSSIFVITGLAAPLIFPIGCAVFLLSGHLWKKHYMDPDRIQILRKIIKCDQAMIDALSVS